MSISTLIQCLVAFFTLLGCSLSEDPIPMGQDPQVRPQNPGSVMGPSPAHCRTPNTLLESNPSQSICVNLSEENVCLRNDYGFVKALESNDPQVFRSCLSLGELQTSSTGLQSHPIRLTFDNNKDHQVAFAQWADRNKDLLRQQQGFFTNTRFGQIVWIGDHPQTEMIKGVLAPALMPHHFDSSRQWPHAPVFLADAEELKAYFTGSDGITRFNSSNPKIIQLLQMHARGPIPTHVTQSITREGCNHTCVRESRKIFDGAQSYSYREYVSHNRVYRSEWVLRGAKDETQALLYLAQGQPNLAVTIERNQRDFPEYVEIRNSKNRVLFQESWQSPQWGVWLAHPGVVDAELAPDELALVGLCEESFRPQSFLQNHELAQIALGPYLNQSFYGWTQDSLTFDYSGREYLNSLSLPMDQYFLDQHSNQVAGELAQTANIGVVPLGIRSCIEAPLARRWYSTFKDLGGKVVNVSLRDPVDKETCLNEAQTHPIFTEQDKVLWVLAAGNQSVSEPNGCPQYLTGQPNVIVVGASQGRRVHEGSNRGDDFVDLFADGLTFDGSGWGTSMATPKVARLAARIFADFPELSVIEVKATIMLSVDRPFRGLPARSEGILDSEAAYELARQISLNQGDVPQALRRQTCPLVCGSNYNRLLKLWQQISNGGE
jgi:hypothetical protein